MFAAIPLLFSLQQFSEGFVWLSYTHDSYSLYGRIATYSFLFFAQVVWPVVIPLSIMGLETDPKRKKTLLVMTGMGALLAVYLTYCLIMYPVSANVDCYHIHYSLDFPLVFSWVSAVFYFIPIVLPAFISSFRRVPLLGLLTLISYFITEAFYVNYFISVWCFFAAMISGLILWVLVEVKRPIHAKKIITSISQANRLLK